MSELTTKTVKVPSSKAEEWDEYVEENPEVDSISHLIRLSVERQMQGRYNEPQTVSDDADTAESGEVLTTLRQVQTSVKEVQERMSAIERVGQAEANYDLKKAVWQMLPEDPGTVVDPGSGPELPDVEGFPETESEAVTAREIAERIGADESAVRETLIELVDTTGQVHRSDTNHDGRHFWRSST